MLANPKHDAGETNWMWDFKSNSLQCHEWPECSAEGFQTRVLKIKQSTYVKKCFYCLTAAYYSVSPFTCVMNITRKCNRIKTDLALCILGAWRVWLGKGPGPRWVRTQCRTS